eukprot:CAMPEP_0202376742 /NCGR_PEP_ID=MMETSP1127-20130417/7167_1 /ASSEMBLY_ACC=CAM_ASM_000462 /TAXON_ID=3047 /ORGANISM="Dunaliella tertiolecta, Strain CCMP1320" /LENGTH=92 /DNA_ID=CAMNT_0048974611 /DNA_START=170 /DNA_END=446 /DNA_ORIENTATION=+
MVSASALDPVAAPAWGSPFAADDCVDKPDASQGSVSWMLEVVGRLEDLLLQRLQREAVEKVTLLQQQLLLLGSMLLLLGLTHYRGLAAACLQ